MKLLKYYLVIFCSIMCLPASAQTQLEKPTYVALNPAFVTNYGSGDRLHYLKVEISVRVESMPDAQLVDKHMPFIRNNLVFLLSEQSEEAVNSPEGRQQLRLAALNAVKEVMKAEENKEIVTDLLFNNFIVQS